MLSDQDILKIVMEARVSRPDLPREVLKARRQPTNWQERRLILVAADHPARRTVAAGTQPWAMANRGDLLRRLIRLLAQPFLDGVLATPDIMEELATLSHWGQTHGEEDVLAGKVLMGSMNRAGLSDTVFEFDDFLTSYDAKSLADSRIDAAKLLLRVNPESPESGNTIGYVAQAIRELSEHNLPVFVEPIPVPLSTDNLVRLMGVASALGPTSRGRWLKVPMVDDFERVAAATTCPLVLLGGSSPGSGEELLAKVRQCASAPNVRGLLMGRGILYPEDGSDSLMLVGRLAEMLGKQAVEVGTWL